MKNKQKQKLKNLNEEELEKTFGGAWVKVVIDGKVRLIWVSN